MEDRIDEILNSLLDTGSNIPYIKELKDKSTEEIKKDLELQKNEKTLPAHCRRRCTV